MRKLKLMPFVLLGSVFGLSACTLPSWLSWLSFIPGLEAPEEEKKEEKKEEEDDDEDKDKKQEYKVSFSSWVNTYAQAGVSGVVIPDYVSENPEVEATQPDASGHPSVYTIVSTTSDEFEDYLEALEAAGWVSIEYDAEEEVYTYAYKVSSLAEGATTAAIYIGDWLDDNAACVFLQFAVYSKPYSSFPSSAINGELASYGFTDTVPAFSGQGSEFSYYGASLGGPQVVVTVGEGNEAAAVATYQSDLTGASYTEFGVDSYGDMQYLSPNGEFLVCVWTYADEDANGNIYIDVLEVPDPEFPSEAIATDLAKYGVTDTLPELSIEATGFDYAEYAEQQGGGYSAQLMIQVSSESSEEATISTYQSDLLAALYTEAGPDKYGDMHYTSPNGQLDVCAWAGSDIGYEGYVFVDIVINS